MTQYPPSPYQPPQPGYPQSLLYPSAPGNSAAALAPARRAAVLLFILGGLGVLGGLCCGVTGSLLPQIIAQQPEITAQIPPEVTPGILQVGMLVIAGVDLIYSIALIVLGLFVRKNSKPAMITAIVLVGLSLLYIAFSVLQALVFHGGEGPASAAGGACFAVIPAVLYGLLLAWLIQALRNVSAARAAAAQYPPHYMQYLQQQYAQQAYQQWQQQQQQQGGYAPPPPTPPAPPSPPPQFPTSPSSQPPPPPTFGPTDGGPRGPNDPQ